MTRRSRMVAGLAVLLLAGVVRASAVHAADGVTAAFNWQAIAQALRGALSSWTFSPVPGMTPTVGALPSATPTRSPMPSATATKGLQSPTRTASATVTSTRTRTPTSTRTSTRTTTATRTWTATATPTATRTSTGTRTSTRTATATRTATWTKVPSATPTPTRTMDPALFTPTPRGDGQIGLALAYGAPPAQKLASALVVFPYLVSTVGLPAGQRGNQDTRVELVNMSTRDQTLQCFYVRLADCVEVGFYVTLTAEQPLAWYSSQGTSNPLTGTSVPPLDGVGELKCAVVPRPEDTSIAAHNVVQGRATVFDTVTGETTAYGAIGIQRVSPGGFGGVIDLGGDYESCPDRLHFQVMAYGSAMSDLVLITCDEDLLMQTPTTTVVQMAIVNEYEQVFSASTSFTCQTVRAFNRATTVLSSWVLGTPTAHLIVRGVSSGVMGLVVERFDALGQRQTVVSEPFLEGARSGTIVFP